jgi:hypothetical protein
MNDTTFYQRQKVRVSLPGGTYCAGWVEDAGADCVGVRLVNGNYRRCKPGDVKAEPAVWAADTWGYDGPG